MQVTFDVPEELAQYLGQDPQALSRAALEALVLEGIRSGALSVAQARRILGLLKSHGVELPLTIEQVRRDSEIALSFSE
jgi:Uncharacterised protein family (UPF0175)